MGAAVDEPLVEHCRWLRWKGHERDAPGPQAHQGFTYSCLRTGYPWGPDDRPAAHESCVAGRPCFEKLAAK
jgi:hypothetical protein